MATNRDDFENLKVIRDTMERSNALTSVSGIGVMGMGAIALIGSYLAPIQSSEVARMYGWLTVAVLGCIVGIISTWYQSRSLAPVIRSRNWRRFVLALMPPIIAGCIFTHIFLRIGYFELMPGTWMLLYGAGVITAGAFSTGLIPIMGIIFMFSGAIGLYLPDSWFQPVWQHMSPIDLYLGAVFGGVHLLFGAIIATKLNS